jgi:hypothetical protein
MNNGRTLTEVIISLEKNRVKKVETRESAKLSEMLGKKIDIKINKIAGGARRSGKKGKSFYVLDPDIEVTITIDGEEIVMEKMAHEVIPDAVLNRNQKILQVLPLVAPAVGELLVGGHTLIDLVVPVATAAVLGRGLPEELAKEATARGSLATGGLPGGAMRATEVARLALHFYNQALTHK